MRVAWYDYDYNMHWTHTTIKGAYKLLKGLSNSDECVRVELGFDRDVLLYWEKEE